MIIIKRSAIYMTELQKLHELAYRDTPWSWGTKW